MKKFLITILVMTYIISHPIYAVTSITTPSKFYSIVNRSDLVIAHFYFKDKALRKNKDAYEKYKWDRTTFRTADKVQKFVKFVRINLASNKLQEIAKTYNVAAQPEYTPIYMLFHQGSKVAEQYIARGALTVGTLQEFILKNFKSQINQKIKDARKERLLRREQAAWLLRRPYYGPFFYHGLYRYHYCPYHLGYHPYWHTCPYWHYGGYHGGYYGRSGFHIGIGF